MVNNIILGLPTDESPSGKHIGLYALVIIILVAIVASIVFYSKNTVETLDQVDDEEVSLGEQEYFPQYATMSQKKVIILNMVRQSARLSSGAKEAIIAEMSSEFASDYNFTDRERKDILDALNK